MSQQEPAAPAQPSPGPAAAGKTSSTATTRAVGQLLAALEHIAQTEGPDRAIAAAAAAQITLGQATVHLARHTAQSVTSALRIVHTDDTVEIS